MTKEPIMIDDVDVSECKHLYTSIIPVGNDKIKCGLHQGKTCDNYPNCYYKQLKHKEQEYDELNKYRPIIDRLLQEFEKYEHIKSISTISYAKQVFEQLDQLKEKNKWYDHYKESALRNKELYNDLSTKYDQLKAENIKFTLEARKLVAQYSSKLERQKQALQEIKKIAETLKKDICSYCDSKDTDRCDQTDIDELEQILQKCEGALNE